MDKVKSYIFITIKSFVYTLIMFLITTFILDGAGVKGSDNAFTILICTTSIVFTMLFCTFRIVKK